MTAADRLELYKAALDDWSQDHYDFTDLGFCHYFLFVHDIVIYGKFEKILPELYAQRKADAGWHYTCREERCAALRAAILITKQKLKK